MREAARGCISVILSSRRVDLNVLNALEKLKKHEPRSARRLVQMGVDTTEQVDDGVLIS